MSLLIYFLLLPLIVTFIVLFMKPKPATYLAAFSFIIPFLYISHCLLSGISETFHIMDFAAPVGEIYMFSDAVSNAFGLAICAVSAMVAFFSLPYMQSRLDDMKLDMDGEYRKYAFLYCLFATSMLWLIYSGSLVFIYTFLEIGVISAFLLIFFYGYEKRRWASILYFVWMLIPGVLAMLSFLMIGFTNSTLALKGLYEVGMLAWAILFIGMIVKLPGIGLHLWLPWTYDQSPTPPLGLLIMADGLAGYILLRIYLVDSCFIDAYRNPILAYALFSGIYAGFSVFRQPTYKRLLGYSSISQMSYMLVALCLGSYGLMGLVIQYLSHSFGKSILLMTAGGIIALYGMKDIGDMGGLHDYMPEISNAAAVGWMNIGGILTVGMLGEFFILRGVVETFELNLWVIIPAVFLFMLSVWYGFYMLRKIFYGRPKSAEKEKKHVSGYLFIPLVIIGLLSVIFLFPPVSPAIVKGLEIIIGGVVP
jgi:NADH-quinone oxidoreductase subunit M